MYDYFRVFTDTKPVREQLAKMQNIVAVKTEELAIKKEALEKINAKIRELQKLFDDKKGQQEELTKKIRECEIKLERA